ncbi:CRE-ZYG-1 protein [Aphelenchoides avenae]|nr:CRE-ZYG-1 protein [Aphelenchus avenae]
MTSMEDRIQLDICRELADYELHEVLGKGSFAVVRRARRKADGTIVAIKAVEKKNGLDPKREKKAMEQLNEPGNRCIVKLYDYFESPKVAYLVMEYCNGGTLRQYVKKYGPLNPEDAVDVLRQLRQAIEYAHRHGIMHRDLSSNNVLIAQKSDKHGMWIKVTDFGLAKPSPPRPQLASHVGTPGYKAPEVGRDKYSEEVDIYSIGCILYLMLTGEDPPRSGGFPSAKLAKLDPDARDLIERLTHPNLKYRLELKDIISQPFMVKNTAVRDSVTASASYRQMRDTPVIRSHSRPRSGSRNRSSDNCKHVLIENGICERCKRSFPREVGRERLEDVHVSREQVRARRSTKSTTRDSAIGSSEVFYQRSRESDVSYQPRRSNSAMPRDRLPSAAQSAPLPSVPRTREASYARDCHSARPATARSSHADQWTFPKIGDIGKGICYKSRPLGRFTLYASGQEPRAVFERARDENDPTVDLVLKVYDHDRPDRQRVVTYKPLYLDARVPEAVDMTRERPRIVEIDPNSEHVARSYDKLSSAEQKAYKMLRQFANSRLAKYTLLHALGTRQFEVKLMYNGDVRLALPDANAVYNPKSRQLVPRSGTQLTPDLETLFMNGVRYILRLENHLNVLPLEVRHQFFYGKKSVDSITREPPAARAPSGREEHREPRHR